MEIPTEKSQKEPLISSNENQEVGHNNNNGKSNKKTLIMIAIAVLLIVIIIGGYFFLNDSKTQPRTTKIGVMLPFSGPAGNSGLSMLKGIQLAKKDLGATTIELLQEDSKCDKESAKKAMKNFIANNVSVVIGGGCSVESLAALPDANKYNILMLSPSSSSPKLSIANDYFFRTIPSDLYQGDFTAQLIYQNRGFKTAAILYSNEPYGKGLRDSFKNKFEKLGGKIVSDISYESGDINLQNKIATIKAAHPGAIYLICNCLTSPGAALRQMAAANVTAPVFGAESLKDDALIKDAQKAAEGLTVTSFSSGGKAFKQAFQAEYGSTGSAYAAPQAYDAFKTIFLAIEKGAKTGKEFKEIISQMEFDGVSGHIKFNKNGEISEGYKYGISQVKNGQFVPLEE